MLSAKKAYISAKSINELYPSNVTELSHKVN